MKTKLFLSALAICSIMTTFVACDKEEPYVDPKQVIESELVDPGVAEEVQEENGTDGISLSYESWIVVYQVFADGSTSGMTRASGSTGNRISVILTNEIVDKDTTINVNSFELSDNLPKIDYKELRQVSHPEQRYVSVIDSATVYTVDRGEFSIDFVLPYQVAVYNDGITKVTMPYHKYYDIKDLGGVLSDVRVEHVDGADYEVRDYQHSLSVFFNGNEYQIKVNALLRKKLVGDYLISKEVIDEGVELVSYDLEAKTGVSKSWIEIEEKWSESGVKKVRKEILLYNGLPDESLNNFSLRVSSKISFSSLSVGKENRNVSDYSERIEDDFVVKRHLLFSTFPVTSSEDEQAKGTHNVLVTYESAVYSDGYITYEMPHFEYGAVNTKVYLVEDWKEDGRDVVMNIHFSSVTNFSSVTYTLDYYGDLVCKSI